MKPTQTMHWLIIKENPSKWPHVPLFDPPKNYPSGKQT